MQPNLKSIYSLYKDEINPLISILEMFNFQGTVVVYGELNNANSYLHKYELEGSEQDLLKAEKNMRHVSILCYKYVSQCYIEQIAEFYHKQRNFDLSMVNDGRFLKKLRKLEIEADKSFKSAIANEQIENIDQKFLYLQFKKVFEMYDDIVKYIKASSKSVMFAKRYSKKLYYIAIGSLCLGVLSIALMFLIN